MAFLLFPDIFAPTQLRGRNVYPDLGSVRLSAEQKEYFLDQVVPAVLATDAKSANEVYELYNINTSTARSWMQMKNRGKKLYDWKGRPPAVDDDGLREIKAAVDEADMACEPLSGLKLKALICDKAKETSMKRNKPYQEITAKTIKATISSCNLANRKSQSTTNARFTACSDPTMSYSMFLMLKAYANELPPGHLWNWDFTQFVINPGETDRRYVSKDRDESRPVTAITTETLDIVIKYMHLGSASGILAPMVLMVSISTMPVDAFVVKRVSSLSQMTYPGCYGYLVFCASRCGNDTVFDWFLNEVVIKTIQQTRDNSNLPVSNISKHNIVF